MSLFDCMSTYPYNGLAKMSWQIGIMISFHWYFKLSNKGTSIFIWSKQLSVSVWYFSQDRKMNFSMIQILFRVISGDFYGWRESAGARRENPRSSEPTIFWFSIQILNQLSNNEISCETISCALVSSFASFQASLQRSFTSHNKLLRSYHRIYNIIIIV